MKKVTFLIVLLALLSSWYGTAQITTYPYSEDFEAGAGGWTATNGANGTWALGAPTATVINSAASGANAWATNLSGDYSPSENSFVQSPAFDLSSLSAPSIQFSIWWNSEFSWDGTVLQSSINSGTSWQNVGAFGDPNNWYTDNNINGGPGGQPAASAQGWSGRGTANGSQGWVVARHALLGLAGQTNVIFRFAFGSDGSIQDNGVAFDSVSIFDVVCPEPSGIAIAGQTATGANISWTPGLNETAWEIAVQPVGTGVPSGNGVATTENSPYVAMSLSPITTYEVYVRADCGANGFSSWAGPVNFTTLCSVFTPDYLATFDTFLQNCWEQADSGTPATGPMTLGTSSWASDGFANVGFSGANSINLWLAQKSDWLLSPQFDLSGGPFQVELDLAIMQYGSTTNAGTLGSDDQVQLLISNDNGVTWVALNTWNNTTPVPAGGEHYLYNLAAYSGQTVQFAVWASEGSVDDATDNEVSFDNFQVRNVPTCPEPTALTSNNISLSSTQVGWTENGTSTLWNIEYGPSGFTQGTGTVITDVTNPYVITNLLPDTLYQFYVQANCGAADGLSSWTGPASFYTGYCTSVPTLVDGDGVDNVTIGVTDFPSLGDDVTYENQTATPVNVFQGIETNVAITFATGYTYDTNIWIDFNDNLVFEGSELVFQGVSNAANPTTLDASFTMPITAPLGQHRMRIGTADTGQVPPNPCYSGFFGVTLDFTINVLILDCTLPTANYTATPDCDGNQFFVDVDVTSLGDATSLELSNNVNANTTQVTTVDSYQIGPFPFGTTVRVFLTNEQNSNCVINSPNLVILGCPPSNDDCSGATVAAVNPDDVCNLLTPGTILAATPSGVPSGTCGGNPNDDVWFQFTALGIQQIINIQNLTGGTTNLDHAVYSGSCGSLVQLYCSPDLNSLTPELTVGETYFIRIFSAGVSPETTNFNLCISTQLPPQFCLGALPICAGITYDSATGDDEAPPYIDYGCLFSQPDPTWNTILFDVAGDYVFTLDQDTFNPADNDDVDFILWGPFNNQQAGCYNLLPESIVDCSYSASDIETITINGVQAGDIYVLLITNYGQSGGQFTFTQNSGPANGTNCEVVCGADVLYEGSPVLEDTDNPGFGVPIELCGASTITLTASSPYADTFEWYEDNIPLNVNTETLTVTQSGVYSVVVSGEVCEDPAQSIQIPVTFYQEPIVNPVPDLVTCDDPSGDGVEAFDLESQTATVLGGQDATQFNVTYHLTLADAANNVGALTSPYTNFTSPQQIWIRIENANSTTCADNSSSFNLVVTGTTPTATAADIVVCDDLSGDGFAPFNLTSNDVNILNGQSATDFAVTYYATMADADAQTSPLASPYTNTSSPQTIYARVDNIIAINCYAIAAFDLIVSPLPTANTAPDLAGCDTDGNNISEYDLTANESAIIGEQAGLTLTYYTTMADASSETSPIGNPTNYETPLTTVYVRVDDAVSGCFNVTSFNLIAGALPVTTFTTDFKYEVCPNATTPIIITATPQNYTAADVSIVWLRNGVVVSGQSGLTLPVLTEGFYEIQVTFNATGCTDIEGVEVILLDNCIIPQGISPDGDGQNDTFDLSNFNVKRIEIFNRLGTLVYSKDNYTNEWYGQSDNGNELPIGTYFYTMVYEGGAKTKSSWVYINR